MTNETLFSVAFLVLHCEARFHFSIKVSIFVRWSMMLFVNSHTSLKHWKSLQSKFLISCHMRGWEACSLEITSLWRSARISRTEPKLNSELAQFPAQMIKRDWWNCTEKFGQKHAMTLKWRHGKGGNIFFRKTVLQRGPRHYIEARDSKVCLMTVQCFFLLQS